MRDDLEPREPGTVVELETRHESYEGVKPQRPRRWNVIYELLEDHPEGLTVKEMMIMLHSAGMLPNENDRNFVAPRVTELVDKGLVEAIGKRQCLYTGKKVAVYAIRNGGNV